MKFNMLKLLVIMKHYKQMNINFGYALLGISHSCSHDIQYLKDSLIKRL